LTRSLSDTKYIVYSYRPSKSRNEENDKRKEEDGWTIGCTGISNDFFVSDFEFYLILILMMMMTHVFFFLSSVLYLVRYSIV